MADFCVGEVGCGARDGCSFKMAVGMERFGATGGASSSPTKSEWNSAKNLIDGADGEQSLSLDGRKVCNIKRVGISQAESNKATVCALPSIHLPLTREARVLAIFEG